MLRLRIRHNSALNDQYQQKLSLKVCHQEDQATKLAADHQERKKHFERIKMPELMAEVEYMDKKQQWLEFINLRIQLAAEVAKSKAQVKLLETPSEVPDNAQAT